jgi:alkanesulfonate monooxygenase SsuD/methylene tetrahydromethanopterin reductase-like flavin-dependent oxidoreductase (luciferase family)
MGLGALCFNLAGYDQMVERVTNYREGIKHANPAGAFINDQVAALCIIHCGEDDQEAKDVAGPEGEWFINKAYDLYRPWHQQGVNVPDSYKYAVGAVEEERLDRTAEDHMRVGAFAMGDPDTCIKVMKQYEAAGVDQVLCFMQMGNLPHSKVMDSIKLFGKHVIPYFR